MKKYLKYKEFIPKDFIEKKQLKESEENRRGYKILILLNIILLFFNIDSISKTTDIDEYTTDLKEVYIEKEEIFKWINLYDEDSIEFKVLNDVAEITYEKNKDIKIIGVEPSSSPLISKKIVGKHKIEGIGANFIPQNFKAKYVDEIALVSDDEAINCSKMMARKKGLLVGISSGAVLAVAKRYCSKFKNVVAILPDGGERYLSVEGFID